MANSNKIALLLINTGSPDAPTEEAVRRYLAEFLGDRRIVELPRWKWWPILHGIILRTRPKKSAERYRGVWTDEGSPLIVHTRRTAGALEAELGIPVYWSMRYGSPSTASVLDRMKADGVGRVLVMSFHGIPQASSNRGDVYEAQCLRTASLLAERLGLEEGAWSVCFQSRFGRDEWLRPYTIDSVRELAEAGTKLKAAEDVCPGFAADCLETIEEIDDELRREYLAAFRDDAGAEFHYIAALNDSPEAVKAYASIVRREAAGWI